MALLSVIIPIYNVEAYLPKCLDSLAAQCFPDVEFILVDDGSTDKSGKIADAYSAGDKRFIVIHTDNQGLSAARNLGIEKASGDWIMFVDGDDWVEPDFCRIPYETASRFGADLVIFRYNKWTNGKIKEKISQQNQYKSSSPQIVSPETALKSGRTNAWNKLYKRDLFNTVRYPEGRVFEDVAVTHKFYWQAERIVMIPDVLYNHVFRKNSISRIKSIKNKKDGFISALERCDDLNRHHIPALDHQYKLWGHALVLLTCADPERDGDDPVVQQAEEMLDTIPDIPRRWNLRKRIMLRVWKTDKHLFHFICRTLGKKDTGDRSG